MDLDWLTDEENIFENDTTELILRRMSSTYKAYEDAEKVVLVPYDWAMKNKFPFDIVSKEQLEDMIWFSRDYKFFKTYDEAVKEMSVKTFHHYKELGDVIMASTYIEVIEQLKDERPELWI